MGSSAAATAAWASLSAAIASTSAVAAASATAGTSSVVAGSGRVRASARSSAAVASETEGQQIPHRDGLRRVAPQPRRDVWPRVIVRVVVRVAMMRVHGAACEEGCGRPRNRDRVTTSGTSAAAGGVDTKSGAARALGGVRLAARPT